MEIRVQSIKFNADQKLLDFVEKKLSKLTKFYDEINWSGLRLGHRLRSGCRCRFRAAMSSWRGMREHSKTRW